MPEDRTSTLSGGLSSPVRSGFAITPHATNELPRITRALYVGGAGNAAVRFAGDDTDVTLTGLLAGVVYPFRLTHVRASGTTATNLVGLD